MIKRFWNGLLTMIFISVTLYAIGHIVHEPLLMMRYELYEKGYLIESGGSVLPLFIGSLCAAIVGRKRKNR